MTDDLVSFLRARLDEDEQVARDAIKPEAMYPWGDTSLPRMPVESWPDAVRGYLGGPWGEHCALHGPVRVLAEVEAKRKIIAMHHPTQSDWPLLRVIALPYADHPDYREEWSP